MKHLLIFFTLLLFCLPLSGCAKPLRERTPLELDMMPNEDLCNIAYLTNEEVLAEKIANIKGSSCVNSYASRVKQSLIDLKIEYEVESLIA